MEAAEGLELSQSAVQQYEANRALPGFEVLLRMGKFYGVSLDWLVYGTGTGEQQTPPPPMSPVKARSTPPAGGMQSGADAGFTAIQLATVDMLRSAVKAGLVSNTECLELMTRWQSLLDAKTETLEP
jgi:hypothetical protein